VASPYGNLPAEVVAGIAVPEALAAIVGADPAAETAVAATGSLARATSPVGRRARRPATVVGADEAVV
jgi:hypothetical protein